MTRGAQEAGAVSGARPARATRRRQTAIDVVSALVLTMLIWPFPVARMNLAPTVHVVSILVLWQVIQVAYYAVSTSVWRKTAGMHLMGLVLAGIEDTAPSRGSAVKWASLSGLLGLVELFTGGPRDGRPDLAERVSDTLVVLAD